MEDEIFKLKLENFYLKKKLYMSDVVNYWHQKVNSILLDNFLLSYTEFLNFDVALLLNDITFAQLKINSTLTKMYTGFVTELNNMLPTAAIKINIDQIISNSKDLFDFDHITKLIKTLKDSNNYTSVNLKSNNFFSKKLQVFDSKLSQEDKLIFNALLKKAGLLTMPDIIKFNSIAKNNLSIAKTLFFNMPVLFKNLPELEIANHEVTNLDLANDIANLDQHYETMLNNLKMFFTQAIEQMTTLVKNKKELFISNHARAHFDISIEDRLKLLPLDETPVHCGFLSNKLKELCNKKNNSFLKLVDTLYSSNIQFDQNEYDTKYQSLSTNLAHNQPKLINLNLECDVKANAEKYMETMILENSNLKELVVLFSIFIEAQIGLQELKSLMNKMFM